MTLSGLPMHKSIGRAASMCPRGRLRALVSHYRVPSELHHLFAPDRRVC
jgi:hypothetical protein